MTAHMNATRDGKMNWFFDQWVYGTDIPSYDSKIKVVPEGGKYRITGTVRQTGIPNDFKVILPLYADLGNGRSLRLAFLPFRGSMSHELDMVVNLPKPPKSVRINPHYDVLSR